jgi:hypothetical protein
MAMGTVLVDDDGDTTATVMRDLLVTEGTYDVISEGLIT